MSFVPRACSHCGGVSFHVIPNIVMGVEHMRTMMGMQVAVKQGGQRWSFTLVACTTCGRSETFTANAAQLASQFEGSQTMTTNRT
jgi:hypothetical protein